MGSSRALAEILDEFLAESPGLLASLEAALRSGDPESAFRAAHSLESSSGAVGALALSELSRTIVEACREGNPTSLREKVALPDQAYARAAEALQAYRSSLAS